jgi:hypothetical protein
VPDHCMTMTWDADYTFTGCVGFEGEFCASLERTRKSTGVVYDVVASADAFDGVSPLPLPEGDGCNI